MSSKPNYKKHKSRFDLSYNANGMQVVVRSLMTTYEKAGAGPTVLLLHGWGDSKETYKMLVGDLKNDFTLIALDLPGFGQTQAPLEAWGLDDYAQFVADFLKKIAVDDVHAFVGHSNGGAIAIRGLAAKTLTANKLVLLASAGVRNTFKGRKKALRLIAKSAKILTHPLPQRVQVNLKKRVYRTVGSEMFVAEHLQETFKRIVEDDVVADTANILIPTLLLYGDHDTATPPSFGKRFKENLPHGELHIIPDAGHFVHQDQPQKVHKFVAGFLT